MKAAAQKLQASIGNRVTEFEHDAWITGVLWNMTTGRTWIGYLQHRFDSYFLPVYIYIKNFAYWSFWEKWTCIYMDGVCCDSLHFPLETEYHQTSNISRSLVDNTIVDHADVTGASPIGPNYMFILDLTRGFNGLDKGNNKTRRETFKFRDLVRLILEVWW